MSDVSQGAGWWLASDGKWYPPSAHPADHAAEAVQSPGWWLASDGKWYPPSAHPADHNPFATTPHIPSPTSQTDTRTPQVHFASRAMAGKYDFDTQPRKTRRNVRQNVWHASHRKGTPTSLRLLFIGIVVVIAITLVATMTRSTGNGVISSGGSNSVISSGGSNTDNYETSPYAAAPTLPPSTIYPSQHISPPAPRVALAPDPETLAPSELVAEVANYTAASLHSIQIPSTVYEPRIIDNQPKLLEGEKPAAVFIGGEYCLFCAATRWPIVAAFSQFGSFSNLAVIHSSEASIATFSFHGASYKSPYIAFEAVERFGNDSYPIQSPPHISELTVAQDSLWGDYSAQFNNSSFGVPLLDIGNTAFYNGAPFEPSVIEGLSQSQIASDLSDPQNAITQNIVGAALYLVASICYATGEQPSSTCATAQVRQIEAEIGL